MEYKKQRKDLDRINFFKNISLKAMEHCVKSFDSDEISEEEDACLRKQAFNLHNILETGRLEHFAIMGAPYKGM